MHDRIVEIVRDYHEGNITLDNMEKYLDFLVHEEDTRYYEGLSKCITATHALSAEEQYIESLRMVNVEDCVDSLEAMLSEDEMRALKMWVIDGLTQAVIAESLSTTQSTISRLLSGIKRKCQDYYGDKELIPMLYKAITYIPPRKRRDAGAPKHLVRWPWEYLCKISMEPKRTKRAYVLKTRCVVPEYFQECFGDDKTVCTECMDDHGNNKCSRRKTQD